MRGLFPLIAAFVAGLFSLSSLEAQTTTVNTAPVGYMQLTCTGSSDTLVSVPFTRPPTYTGAVAAVSGSTVTVSGSTGWSVNQFVYVSGSQANTYYALLQTGTSLNPKAGCIYTVASNGSNAVTLSLNGDSLSTVPVGAQVSIIPYWTLGTVFPATSATTAFVSSSSQFIRATQLLIPNYSGSGTDLSVTATNYFYNGNWRKFGDATTTSHDDDIVLPNGYIIVRNPSTTTTLTAMGCVVTGTLTTPLAANATGGQDNYVAMTRPVDVSLDATGLVSSGAIVSSSSQFLRADQVLVFNNSAPGFDKSASATYYYMNGAWRLFGDDPTVNHGADIIPAGTGFVIRKAGTGAPSTAFWQNAATY